MRVQTWIIGSVVSGLLMATAAPALAWEQRQVWHDHGDHGGWVPAQRVYPAPQHHHHRGFDDGAAIALGVGVGALLAAPMIVHSAPAYRPPPQVIYAPPPQVVYAPPPQVVQAETCREFQSQVLVNGMMQPAYGIACLQPDGSWKIVR